MRALILVPTLALGTLLALTGCGGLGACVGSDAIFDNTYCYSDFDRGECDDYDDQEVNGGTWSFYPGDTCADLGYGEGSN